MFLNLLILISICAAAVIVVVNISKTNKKPLILPVYNNHPNLADEHQVCATFAREAKAAPLNPNENEDVTSLYSTL